MNALQNFGFKMLMYLLIVIIVCAAIYALIWKLATVMLLILVMSPFALAIMWKIKKVAKNITLAQTEKTNHAPYKV